MAFVHGNKCNVRSFSGNGGLTEHAPAFVACDFPDHLIHTLLSSDSPMPLLVLLDARSLSRSGSAL